MRKLNPQTINRLYWMDELSIAQIARKLHVCFNAVRSLMERKGIPRRPSGRKGRIPAECCIKGCTDPPVRAKRWVASRKRYEFRQTCRCALHLREYLRAYARKYFRQRRNSQRVYRRQVIYRGSTWIARDV